MSYRNPVRIITFSTLYPNPCQPRHGIFVEQRLRHLLASGAVAARVIAPVPWFPWASSRFGRYAQYARIPRREERHGVQIEHPSYPVIPKIGMNVAPLLLERASWPSFASAAQGQGVELIDAHYFYPDGVAATRLARRLNKPVVITARGTDVNLIPKYAKPRKQIVWAAEHCAAIVAVSQAIKDALVEIGVAERKITVLRNGVDLDVFRPLEREVARARLDLAEGFTLLSVGLLIERKGHHLAIEALRELPDVNLIVVGEGEERSRLERLARDAGVAQRVRFVGNKTHRELCEYYSAADCLVLASSREGMANVLLESIACGTPVVATPIWGNPEVVAQPAAGVLMRERSGPALAAAVQELRGRYPRRNATRAYAERFSWDETTEGQIRLFERVCARKAA